jgi:3-hydroxymyristoyl/3-hydroxydecanoyl-(acyl carrier protein) dehydratase
LRLAAVRGVKILGSARPGQTIRLEVRITGRLGAVVQAQAAASVAGDLVLTGELTLGSGVSA